jgi:hypothetical protein
MVIEQQEEEEKTWDDIYHICHPFWGDFFITTMKTLDRYIAHDWASICLQRLQSMRPRVESVEHVMKKVNDVLLNFEMKKASIEKTFDHELYTNDAKTLDNLYCQYKDLDTKAQCFHLLKKVLDYYQVAIDKLDEHVCIEKPLPDDENENDDIDCMKSLKLYLSSFEKKMIPIIRLYEIIAIMRHTTPLFQMKVKLLKICVHHIQELKHHFNSEIQESEAHEESKTRRDKKRNITSYEEEEGELMAACDKATTTTPTLHEGTTATMTIMATIDTTKKKKKKKRTKLMNSSELSDFRFSARYRKSSQDGDEGEKQFTAEMFRQQHNNSDCVKKQYRLTDEEYEYMETVFELVAPTVKFRRQSYDDGTCYAINSFEAIVRQNMLDVLGLQSNKVTGREKFVSILRRICELKKKEDMDMEAADVNQDTQQYTQFLASSLV